jgi:RNA polymerase sigma-70 factor (ECF subfamily)
MLPFSPTRIVGGFNRNEPEINKCIYDYYYPIVARKIREQIGNSPDLAELVSIVFTKLWSRKVPFKVIKELRDYIYITAFHVWSDYLKKQNDIKFSPADISHFYFLQSTDELKRRESEAYLLDLIYREVENLPVRTREVFLMHNKEYLPVEEIAKKLGMTEKTARNHLSLAMKILKMKLKRKSRTDQTAVIFLLINFLYDKF